MAVPKRKVSHARKATRRGGNWKLEAPAFCVCTNCGTLKVAHHTCRECGFYKGREVVKVNEEV
ncbi:50S ribosomal protein L32 [Clostridia bacterium]|nr:50S ribosomal protein L32 [Clostridia bacterium]